MKSFFGGGLGKDKAAEESEQDGDVAAKKKMEEENERLDQMVEPETRK